MLWLTLILFSAVALGLYDVGKKHAVTANAVIPVLWFSTLVGTVTVLIWQISTGVLVSSFAVTPHVWVLLLIKSLIVASSWICAYYAMRMLPITIAAPIRGSQPVWTVIGALIIFAEWPSPLQWAGILVITAGYFLFSVMGRKEGIRFHADKGVFLIFLATILGAVSGLYDKYLLQPCGLHVNTVQLWFQIDLVVIIGIVLLFQRSAKLARTPFTWKWSIILVGVLLVISDWLYFTALYQPGVLISVLSPLRRSNAVISFFIGGIIFRDTNRRGKALALAVIILGVILLFFSSQ